MRTTIMLMRGNVRKNKGAYISVLVLMLIVAMAVTVVASVMLGTKERDKKKMEECGFGDIITWMSDETLAAVGETSAHIADELRACDDIVESVDEVPCVYMSLYELNGKSSSTALVCAFDYAADGYSFEIYDGDGRRVENPTLESGQIIVPVCYQYIYDCKIGDTVYFGDEDNHQGFEVAYFFEDPYIGASLMGVKEVLLYGDDVERIAGKQVSGSDEGSSIAQPGCILSVHKRGDCELSDMEMEQQLGSRVSYTDLAYLSLLGSQMYMYMTLFTDIFAAILAIFILVLTAVTLIVIRHNIRIGLEQEYRNYGVLKAVGVTNSSLTNATLFCYCAFAMLGMAVGVCCGLPFVSMLNNVLIPITGLYVQGNPELFETLCALLIILACMVLIILVALSRLRRITPVKAMREGRPDVHFSSVLRLPVSKRFLNASLAYRQFTSGKRQYAGALLITSLLGAFLILMTAISTHFADESTLISMFSSTDEELWCTYKDEGVRTEVEDMISQSGSYESFCSARTYLNLMDVQIQCSVNTAPEHYKNILSGRTCLYENEVLITEYVAEQFDVGIGDSVQLTAMGKSADFIVSGLYQSANDAGKTIAINADGYKRLTGEDFEFTTYYYCLGDSERAGNISDRIKAEYDESVVEVYSIEDEYVDFDPFMIGIKAVTMFTFAVTAIFIIVTVFLSCRVMFVREQRDYGIYRTAGFSYEGLRRQFAVRFVFVSVAGCVLGVALYEIFGKWLVTALFSMVGVSRPDMGSVAADITTMLAVLAFITLMYYIFAYIASARIKRYTTIRLTEE